MGIVMVLLSSSAEYLNYCQEKYVMKTSLWCQERKESCLGKSNLLQF